ncbi:MAG: D-glycero-beta-D-manno-heptose-7-phosphate kinase [Desulfobacterales bacterium]|nr:D-glycero-beta-D-manno-heptose-7-phosphate kinase [Desulfobacterales bacterium]
MRKQFQPSQFNGCKVLVIGDLMIDEYWWGEVERISPEAPVPVVSVLEEAFTLGGAGNVINNLVALGANVFAAGVIGTGQDGDILIEKFKALGLETQGIVRVQDRPTTRKTRIIASNQHIVRIDRESKSSISIETAEKLADYISNKIKESDIVVISDYAKGVLTPDLLKHIIFSINESGKIGIADPKGLDYTKYSGLTLITPNKKEAALASRIDIVDESSLIQAAEVLSNKLQIPRILITCGKDGMMLWQENTPPCMIQSQARQVYDVSGAGDTVISVLSLCLATGMSFEESAIIANVAAGIVVGKLGTATITSKELSDALNPSIDVLFKNNLRQLKNLVINTILKPTRDSGDN